MWITQPWHASTHWVTWTPLRGRGKTRLTTPLWDLVFRSSLTTPKPGRRNLIVLSKSRVRMKKRLNIGPSTVGQLYISSVHVPSTKKRIGKLSISIMKTRSQLWRPAAVVHLCNRCIINKSIIDFFTIALAEDIFGRFPKVWIWRRNRHCACGDKEKSYLNSN